MKDPTTSKQPTVSRGMRLMQHFSKNTESISEMSDEHQGNTGERLMAQFNGTQPPRTASRRAFPVYEEEEPFFPDTYYNEDGEAAGGGNPSGMGGSVASHDASLAQLGPVPTGPLVRRRKPLNVVRPVVDAQVCPVCGRDDFSAGGECVTCAMTENRTLLASLTEQLGSMMSRRSSALFSQEDTKELTKHLHKAIHEFVTWKVQRELTKLLS